ncbi:MAG: TaqI-like C-terminal specificity domain-containing protein, partial [Patescibacteria group bacterium]
FDIFKTNKIYCPILKQYFKNSNINKYYTSKNTNLFVIYSNKETEIEQYPKIYKHLLTSKNIIQEKRWKESVPWYSLVRARNENIFIAPKIVCPQRSFYNNFGYNKISWYAGSDVFFITLKSEIRDIDLKFILSLLNSKLYYLWLYNRGKRKGEALELIVTPLSEIPIKKISIEKQKQFIKIVDKILALTSLTDYPNNLETKMKIKDYENQIDLLVYKIYNLTPEEIKIVERNSLILN